MKTNVTLFINGATKVLRDEATIAKCRKLKCPVCDQKLIVSHTSSGKVAERTIRRITMQCKSQHVLILCDEFKTQT
jgi:hypothetical protein